MLSEQERQALASAIRYGDMLTHGERKLLVDLIVRTAPRRPDLRFIVKCKSRFAGRVWEVFYDKLSAQQYARHAVESWCDRSDVRIYKQKWINY